MPYSFCHNCGAAYGPDAVSFPKKCAACGHIHYRNPIPVAVALIPCEDGLLGVIRGIEPKKGFNALPGGFQDMESLEQACSRETLEETGVALDTSVWRYRSNFLTPNGNLLVFFKAEIDPIPMPAFPFAPPAGVPMETDGFEIIRPGSKLAFPSHEAASELVLAEMAAAKRG